MPALTKEQIDAWSKRNKDAFEGLLNVNQFVPITSDVQSGILAGKDFIEGNYLSSLGNAAGLIPFVPSLGATIAKNIPSNPTSLIYKDNNVVDIINDGNKVGSLKYQIKDGLSQIIRADVDEPFRNKGIGTQAHEQFIKDMFNQGYNVGSDSMLTKGSVRIFEKLKDKGYNVQQSPEAQYVGKYLIPTTKSDKNWDRLNTTTREYRLQRGKDNPNIDMNELASGGIPAFTIFK